MADDDRGELARQAAELDGLRRSFNTLAVLVFVPACGLALVIMALRAKGVLTGSLLSEAFSEVSDG